MVLGRLYKSAYVNGGFVMNTFFLNILVTATMFLGGCATAFGGSNLQVWIPAKDEAPVILIAASYRFRIVV